MPEPSATNGQAAASDPQGTTEAAPGGSKGQSATVNQTTSKGPDSGTESFFDPKSIEDKPELLAAYKQMQAKFTKSQTKLKDGAKKIEAYDAFLKDPQGTIQQIAQQYGYQLVKGSPATNGDDTPKTWDDVYDRAKQAVLKDLEPVLGEVRNLKQQNVEAYLDNRYADWRTYEDDMLELIKAHPSLSKDPDKLYKLAVPEQVWEARAIKAAKAKLNNASEGGQISGAGATSKATANVTTGIKSFNEAVAAAKAKLAREGIHP